MINEKVDIEIDDLVQEDETKKMIALLADNLYLSAPSDSFMKLVFKKSQGVVKASCRIASQVGVFAADVVGQTPVSTIRQLEKRIQDQLKLWKLDRFERA